MSDPPCSMHDMESSFAKAEQLLDQALATLDVECMGANGLRDFVRRMDRFERKAAGAKALAVGAMTRIGAWEDGSARSAADWVARETGVSWGAAGATVALGEGLRALPTTATALLKGRISETKAALVTKGASADPHAERELLALADHGSVKELRDAADRIVAASTGQVGDEQAAVHRTRYLKMWTASDSAFRIEGRLTKAAGAKVRAVLEPLMEVEFADARRQGRRESNDAYLADALVEMAERARAGGRDAGSTRDAARRKPPSATVIVRVDHAALVRGHVEGDEVSEVVGVGPVPISDVQQYMSDPMLKVLLTKGSEVVAASTMTRVVRSNLREALVERDRLCVVPGCGISKGLEIDHLVPFAQGGPTSIDNLQRLCKHHHRLKTTGRATLTRWETADGPRFGWLARTAEGSEPPPAGVGGTPDAERGSPAWGSGDAGTTVGGDGEPPGSMRTLWTA